MGVDRYWCDYTGRIPQYYSQESCSGSSFQRSQGQSPSAEDTYQILKGIKPLYEAHHNIELPDEVLRAAVDYSVQYIPQRSLPDKAIDLVDVTAAHLAAQHPVTDIQTLEAEMAEAKQLQLEAAEKEDYEKP